MLARVLDEIIPPSDDGRLPGAGELGVAGYVEQALRSMPELRAMIVQGLTDLDALARSRHAQRFASLSRSDKLQLLNEQAFVLPLTSTPTSGTTRHPRVVEALGLEPRPPHPQGYEMEPERPDAPRCSSATAQIVPLGVCTPRLR